MPNRDGSQAVLDLRYGPIHDSKHIRAESYCSRRGWWGGCVRCLYRRMGLGLRELTDGRKAGENCCARKAARSAKRVLGWGYTCTCVRGIFHRFGIESCCCSKEESYIWAGQYQDGGGSGRLCKELDQKKLMNRISSSIEQTLRV